MITIEKFDENKLSWNNILERATYNEVVLVYDYFGYYYVRYIHNSLLEYSFDEDATRDDVVEYLKNYYILTINKGNKTTIELFKDYETAYDVAINFLFDRISEKQTEIAEMFRNMSELKKQKQELENE